MDTAATPYKVLRVLYRWPGEERELPTDSAHEPPIIPEQPVPIIPADRLVATALPAFIAPRRAGGQGR